MRVLSGVQPSGNLHIGNYFGAIRQFVQLQEEHECFYFLADLHALTTVQDPTRFRDLVTDLATGFLAFGLDPLRYNVDAGDLGCEFELVMHAADYLGATDAVVRCVVIRLVIDDASRRYHMPVMLSPHSYSTWWS